ncbi:MMPL family transporter [archaeon]|nr:MMPL family transporter [archaeon]NCP79713.1 MMPL family transporter [archaeon]NCP98003.1 MMPL family transporter [archaeon]NCQ07479.1 MMPL family transporter [archaeon]NCQ51270.1 MMPL family transporter [archaeon]
MRTLIKKPIIIFWIILIIISLVLLLTNGLKFGVDFSGGTAFQVVLEESVSSEELAQAASILGRRLDWSGSKDARVTPSGSQYITIQIAESDPDEIASLRSAILKQGNFEAVLNGDVLFSGEDIKSIYKDPSRGYGISEVSKGVDYQWSLPFLLSPDSAKRFAEMTFHKCTPTGISSGSLDERYECDKTYFFVDRPVDSIILIDNLTFTEEKEVPVIPGLYSSFFPIEDLLDQVTSPYYVIDGNLSAEDVSSLTKDLENYSKVIVSPGITNNDVNSLKELGFKVISIEKQENLPWIWSVTGLKSVISITPGIANMDVSSMESSRFQTFSQLNITGHAESLEASQARLDDLLLILESGSLPIAIDSISTESISPFLGKQFLNTSLLIGLFAILTVAVVLFIRYKRFSLAAPIILTASSEILILLGILSLMSFRLDLAAVAGILATIGTGVDDNIIIIDELLRGKKKDEHEHHESLLKKIKKAFFIMFAAAATAAATMFPIIFFSLGLGKLVGFAVTILIGTAIGVFLVRPVYAQIARKIVAEEGK